MIANLTPIFIIKGFIWIFSLYKAYFKSLIKAYFQPLSRACLKPLSKAYIISFIFTLLHFVSLEGLILVTTLN